MPLGLQTGGGDFLPIVKYNAKAGRWYKRNEDKTETEVTNMTAVFDLDNIEIGFIKFHPDGGPDARLAPANQPMPPSPGEGYKNGFRVKLFSPANLDGLREWMANSGLANEAMNDLYSMFEAEVGNHNGEAPVVQFLGADPISGKHGTNYKPRFEIVQWVKRPAELDAKPAAAPANGGAQAASAPAQQAAPPPPPPAAPASNGGAAVEF